MQPSRPLGYFINIVFCKGMRSIDIRDTLSPTNLVLICNSLTATIVITGFLLTFLALDCFIIWPNDRI